LNGKEEGQGMMEWMMKWMMDGLGRKISGQVSEKKEYGDATTSLIKPAC
jgi:hypothetical protein